jgi:hypothetical protein
VLDDKHCTFWAWFSVNPAVLVWSWKELLQDLEKEDLQGFPNEKIIMCKFLDMVCAMRSSKNVSEDNVETCLQSDTVELGLKHTDRYGHCHCYSVSLTAEPCSVLTLLNYMVYTGFKYSDSITARKICIAVRSPNSSKNQATITHCFSK